MQASVAMSNGWNALKKKLNHVFLQILMQVPRAPCPGEGHLFSCGANDANPGFLLFCSHLLFPHVCFAFLQWVLSISMFFCMWILVAWKSCEADRILVNIYCLTFFAMLPISRALLLALSFSTCFLVKASLACCNWHLCIRLCAGTAKRPLLKVLHRDPSKPMIKAWLEKNDGCKRTGPFLYHLSRMDSQVCKTSLMISSWGFSFVTSHG